MLSTSCSRSAFWPLPSLAGVALCAGMAVGCDVNIREGKASVAVFSAEATDEWTHHYPLAADGLVEVVNINGPVEITTGAAGVVEVHATITAKTLTEAGARDILAKGKLQETAEPSRVHIEAAVPRGIRGSYQVRLEVKVPPGSRLDVSTTNGSLNASGLEGNLKAMAVNGKVEIENVSGRIDVVVANGSLTARLSRVTGPVRLEATNGRLALELPSTTKANLSARVVNGGLGVSGLPVAVPAGGRIRNLETLLNGGGPEISLSSTNGRISIDGK
jgi:hypothetical protein